MMIFVAGVLASCGESPQKGAAVHSVMLTTPVSMEGSVVKKHSGIVREAHTINLGFKTAGQIERTRRLQPDYDNWEFSYRPIKINSNTRNFMPLRMGISRL